MVSLLTKKLAVRISVLRSSYRRHGVLCPASLSRRRHNRGQWPGFVGSEQYTGVDSIRVLSLGGTSMHSGGVWKGPSCLL